MRTIIDNKVILDTEAHCTRCGARGAYDCTSEFVCWACMRISPPKDIGSSTIVVSTEQVTRQQLLVEEMQRVLAHAADACPETKLLLQVAIDSQQGKPIDMSKLRNDESSHAGFGSYPEPCSGFAVVLRYGGNRYKSVCHPNAGQGIRADEVWIFGDPQTRAEREIWMVVAPTLAWVPDQMVHRIPNR